MKYCSGGNCKRDISTPRLNVLIKEMKSASPLIFRFIQVTRVILEARIETKELKVTKRLINIFTRF